MTKTQTIEYTDVSLYRSVFFDPPVSMSEADYLTGQLPPRYPVPAIPIRTVIDYDVVFQAWQYKISTNNTVLNEGRCLAGDYYAMLHHWRRG